MQDTLVRFVHLVLEARPHFSHIVRIFTALMQRPLAAHDPVDWGFDEQEEGEGGKEGHLHPVHQQQQQHDLITLAPSPSSRTPSIIASEDDISSSTSSSNGGAGGIGGFHRLRSKKSMLNLRRNDNGGGTGGGMEDWFLEVDVERISNQICLREFNIFQGIKVHSISGSNYSTIIYLTFTNITGSRFSSSHLEQKEQGLTHPLCHGCN